MGKALKVGVFYDGSYFSHVSNYYNYVHPHSCRLHIGGLHEFIKYTIAERENTEPNLCHIIDAHFFRGRFSAKDANEKSNQLYYDRVFDDVLMYNGVQAHYLPVKDDRQGHKREKGVDVLMALETFELCMYKRYDVVVLVASDGDHVPLVKKLHTLGCKTMLLGWEFEYTDETTGKDVTTKTSADLWNEVSYPLEMSTLVEDGLREDNEVVRDMFVEKSEHAEPDRVRSIDALPEADGDGRHESTIMNLGNGIGFIKFPNNNVFFHYDELEDVEFNELQVGDTLKFELYTNNRNQQQARHIERVAVAETA